jgi:arylformamidase
MADIIDLTRVLDAQLPIYTSGSYSDPPLEITTWCTVEQQGYAVARLCMGTQTGTHIDAPAHFLPGGATLEALPVDALMGRYLWADLAQLAPSELEALRLAYAGESILFLASAAAGETHMPEAALKALLELPCMVWVSTCEVRVSGHDELYFHRALAQAGRYLVEDVDEAAARRVRPGGELMALPLRLSGVSGSPCRVVVKRILDF